MRWVIHFNLSTDRFIRVHVFDDYTHTQQYLCDYNLAFILIFVVLELWFTQH